VLTCVHACMPCVCVCVRQVLLELADDFLENLISAGSVLAKHRGSDVLEVRDVALHMERAWDMRLPGYSFLRSLLHLRLPHCSASHFFFFLLATLLRACNLVFAGIRTIWRVWTCGASDRGCPRSTRSD
jgi:hypothetical protein